MNNTEFIARLQEHLGYIGRVTMEFDQVQLSYVITWRLFDICCIMSFSDILFRSETPEYLLRYVEDSFRDQSQRIGA